MSKITSNITISHAPPARPGANESHQALEVPSMDIKVQKRAMRIEATRGEWL
jgi:hypothetical protein